MSENIETRVALLAKTAPESRLAFRTAPVSGEISPSGLTWLSETHIRTAVIDSLCSEFHFLFEPVDYFHSSSL